jgi:hypothetical protein
MYSIRTSVNEVHEHIFLEDTDDIGVTGVDDDVEEDDSLGGACNIAASQLAHELGILAD